MPLVAHHVSHVLTLFEIDPSWVQFKADYIDGYLTVPNGGHSINSTDKFENLLLEQFKDVSKKVTEPTI